MFWAAAPRITRQKEIFMFRVDFRHIAAQATFNSMVEADFQQYNSLDALKRIEDELGLDHPYSEDLFRLGGFIQTSLKGTALAVMSDIGCEGHITLDSISDYAPELITNTMLEFINSEYESLKTLENGEFVTHFYIYLLALMAYKWLTNKYNTNNKEAVMINNKTFKYKKDYDKYVNSLLKQHGYSSVDEVYTAHPEYEDADIATILNDGRFNVSFKYYSEADEAQDILNEQIQSIYDSYKEDIADLYIDIDNIERSVPLNKRDELIAQKQAEIDALVSKRDAEIDALKAEFNNSNSVDPSEDGPTYDATNNTFNSEEGSYMSNPVYFNSDTWELVAPKNYFYKGSNPLYPCSITADDFNLNSLLDLCMGPDFKSDNKAFYIKSEPTSDRKNGASKSFMFLKDGSAVYCIDSVSKKMRELSMSAAGGKDGIVSRPYYYISFPLAGKNRQLPLHKVLAVFANADELISVRNKLGLPLCGLVPNHKDNNGINNNVSNLEWVSPDENKLHSSAVELLAMADGGQFKYLVDKDHTPEVWVSAKDQWVIPSRNILNFQLSIKDIYNYLNSHHITIAGHSIRAIVNIFDFINFLKAEGVIKEA